MSKRSKAILRLNRLRLYRLWRYIRAKKKEAFPLSELRGLFSWNWGFAWFFASMAVGLIAIGTAVEPFGYLFDLGRLFLLLCIISALGWWLTSEQLERRKPKPQLTRKQRKHGEKPTYVAYRIWKWGGVGLIVIVITSAIHITSKTELSRELSLDHGWLIPASESDPPNSCAFETTDATGRTIKLMPENALKVFLGKFMVSYSMFPHNIFSVNGKNPLILNRDQSGRIALTMDILDRDEKVVVRFTDGHFTVNRNTRLDMERPDRSTLIVSDNYGNEVLNIRYLNKNAVVISALLQYSHAKPVHIPKTKFSDVCLGDAGSTGINFNSPD